MHKPTTDNEDTSLADLISTRVLMISSALFLGVLGVCLTFVPTEILKLYDDNTHQFTILLAEATGALYLGFAMLNWMARGNLIGGIYSRPVALGNFLHFFMIALLLLKETLLGSLPLVLIIIAIFYTTFAAVFGYILFSGGKSCA